jgi:TonB-dependent receptor-like protein
MLADIAGQAQVTWGVNPFSMHQWQNGYFIQDDFKVRSNLVLNLGVRYDYFSVPNERDDRLFNRSEPFGFGPLRPADSIYDADYNNFSPRFGFAWTVGSSAKTVIRGGFGMFINPHTLFGGPVETVRNAIDEPTRFIFSRDDVIRLGLKYPITNAGTLQYAKNPNAPWSGTSINTDFPNPYSLQWTLSVQRELTNTMAFETAFVGNRGVKLNMVRDENLVDRQTGLRNPAFGTFRYYDTSESSHYSAWQTSLRKRFSQDLSFNVHYTWARSISFQDGDLLLPDQRVQDINNLNLDRGPSPFDINHRFVSDFLYELPFARLADASTRGKKLLLAGWQFAGIYSAESGFPLNVLDPSGYSNARVDYVGGNTLLNDASRPLQYLNRAAFARPPISSVSGVPSRPGTLGRNALRGPGLWNIDLALSKTLAFTERVNLQIRTDMINAFNHTNFLGIQTGITTSNFGAFTSTRGARLVQFNARLTF